MPTTEQRPPDVQPAGTTQAAVRSGRSRDRNTASLVFLVALWLSLALAVVFLMTLVITTAIQGAPRFDANLFTEYDSTLFPQQTGIRAGILGTLWLMLGTALLAVPLGIAAALYLEEFADRDRWYNRLIELNLQNLAAVPSVIYGMLAVGFMSLAGRRETDIVIGGALALALLVLPVVIIATRESIRAVPREIRDGSLALGATRWQTSWRQVLPSAVPGISTGTILALSRAIGEAAPLLLLGVAITVQFDPNGFLSAFTALPIQIYNMSAEAQTAYHIAAAAAIIVLLAMVLLLNGLAIYIRNHFARRW
ncbi:MAG: phosphate ABC transporter permease PstA [Actinomycetota bacterium]|nr:phosphate ABC transporter permease PstA [Actinomycetota bacterium]